MTADESPGLINPSPVPRASPIPAQSDLARLQFELRLDEIKAEETARAGRRQIWLAHHWPDHYQERCVGSARSMSAAAVPPSTRSGLWSLRYRWRDTDRGRPRSTSP